MEIFVLYSTFPDTKSVNNIVQYLLENKIIACANSHVIISHYIWENEIKNENEIAVIFKTSLAKQIQLEKKLTELHPYSIPCFLSYKVKCNETYYKWVYERLK